MAQCSGEMRGIPVLVEVETRRGYSLRVNSDVVPVSPGGDSRRKEEWNSATFVDGAYRLKRWSERDQKGENQYINRE
jgi:hypothetical protein